MSLSWSFIFIFITEGWALPYLNIVGDFPSIDPCFRHFLIPLDPLFMLNSILLTCYFCRKNWFVFITFSSRKNSPKVGLIIHKNLSVDHFEAFCTNYLLGGLIFDLFDPSFLQNLRSRWVHF